MPFKPFTKSGEPDADDRFSNRAPSAATFTKKKSRKQRKAAPAQKALMQSGRSMSGGGR